MDAACDTSMCLVSAGNILWDCITVLDQATTEVRIALRMNPHSALLGSWVCCMQQRQTYTSQLLADQRQ